MRSILTALVMAAALVLTVPALAQTHTAANSEEPGSTSPIDINMVGGGILALVTASGLLNIYEAGSLVVQGSPLGEALEVGTGFPLICWLSVEGLFGV